MNFLKQWTLQKVQEGLETTLGTDDWHPTLPITVIGSVGCQSFDQDNFALDDNQTLIDDHTLTHTVVQLVILEFLPPDAEHNRDIMVACEENDDKLLAQNLNQATNPNFEDANQCTPLYVAASNGNLKCVLLLLEAGANQDQGRTDSGATPLFIAASFWWRLVPTKTKA